MNRSVAPAQIRTFQSFRAASSIGLGGLVGALIGAPAGAATQPPMSVIIVVAATGLGFVTGYRRRNSVAFFYFALAAACILAGLLAVSGLQVEQ